jgi:glycosyltransferase involved in cell wall biosynthesis
VLSDLRALAQGIELRRGGTVSRLIVGPNLLELPSEAEELMSAPEIDAVVVPSEWIRKVYELDCPALAGRVALWPAGVDTGYWSPARRQRRRAPRAFVFHKAREVTRSPGHEAKAAAEQLRERGFDVTVLLYGRFTQRGYRSILRECDLGVVFGHSESQGLALAEAWSVGVPTLVRTYPEVPIGGRTFACSAAPYLSASTGAFFADAQQLASLLDRWRELAPDLDPRGWVLANMTDEICARAYLALATKRSAAELRCEPRAG